MRSVWIGILCTLVASAAHARPSRATLDSSDEKFIVAAAQSGSSLVKLAGLAEGRGASPAVRQLGQQIAQERQKVGDELLQLALNKGVRLQREQKPENKALYATLTKLHGGAFDKQFLDGILKDQQQDLALFEKAAAGAKDPQVKEWAAKTLPALQKHLKAIQDLAAPAPSAPPDSQPTPPRARRGRGK